MPFFGNSSRQQQQQLYPWQEHSLDLAQQRPQSQMALYRPENTAWGLQQYPTIYRSQTPAYDFPSRWQNVQSSQLTTDPAAYAYYRGSYGTHNTTKTTTTASSPQQYYVPMPTLPSTSMLSRATTASTVQPRRYFCDRPNCNAAFTRQNDVHRHIETKHSVLGTFRYSCNFCDKQFARADKQREHINICSKNPSRTGGGS